MSIHGTSPVAVVGTACRFAGDATSPSKLWDLVKSPRDVLSRLPGGRFNADGFYHPDSSYHGHFNVQNAHTLDQDVREFDAQFFGVKPVEARALDPQQRLLLEVAYEGLEAAGLPMESLRGSNTGVYVGLMSGDYEFLQYRDLQNIPTYHSVGTSRSTISNRLSYFFDWHGPSMTVDTACSSSLVALHLAVQELRRGEARVALVCGSNLLLGPEPYIAESKLGMLSPDGRSRMWDANADGYARGDGVAVVVLKTLAAALEDGDHIECIVRETGINQDGATMGITMPSAGAQQRLILDTYDRAGLNFTSIGGRCQYFEAHGTGTPAGDPIEAEAIHRALTGPHHETHNIAGAPLKHPLFVGSIKTVLGHTEGTAGLAGLLKASLALQNRVIPPNLLFNRLNPQIAPFYNNLEIPTTAKPWPMLPTGQPRRASVNSFGFGGTNAHAILESYDRDEEAVTSTTVCGTLFIPFVFSANSEHSLRALLVSYSEFLASHASLSAQDLAWTLFQRRSALPYRVSISADTIEGLTEAINERTLRTDAIIGAKSLARLEAGTGRILGVFTGQGAQYARMGTELVEASAFARDVIRELEADLSRLPDRPSWSLEAELLAGPSSSRLQEAAISQPLCAAVQILLVRLLRLAHVRLDAVVGHSSGEIVAAYAAGYISSRDAIRIAYYRGMHCAAAAEGLRTGAMLAVGTSMEDAGEVCALPEFKGRVVIAASNSPTSVTLSGDGDAIAELEDVFADEGKFVRRLAVSTAYHSHHMLSCAEPYAKSLKACGIQVQELLPECAWFSSVQGKKDSDWDRGELADIYWVHNMVRPVLFCETVELALSTQNFDMALEIGAHPALKRPISEITQQALGRQLLFTGMLSRGASAVTAVSDSLGHIFANLGREAVNLERYQSIMNAGSSFSLVKNLPTYSWDHRKTYWHESRLSRSLLQREGRANPLLGHATPDSSPHNLSWRNLLRLSELPWISGHQVQNQVVFPGAGYAVSAIEASRSLAGGQDIKLIEVEDLSMLRSITLDDEDAGVETLVCLTGVDRSDPTTIKADFTYSAALDKHQNGLTLVSSATVKVRLGEASPDILPPRGPPVPHMVEVMADEHYSAMSDLGYNFSGSFKGLSSLRRKLGRAAGQINQVAENEDESIEPCLIHPVTLDAALQSITVAYAHPRDERIRSLHIPQGICRLRVNPVLCGRNWSSARTLLFDSATVDGVGIQGDVYVYDGASRHAAVQVEKHRAVPMAEATAADDRRIFSKMTWKVMEPDVAEAVGGVLVTPEEADLASALERLSSFYTRKFDRDLPLDHPARSEQPHCYYLNFCKHMKAIQESGEHPYVRREWLDDTLDDVLAAIAPFSKTVDVRIIQAVGEQMPRVFRGETTILEHLRPGKLLDEYYSTALGSVDTTNWVAHAVGQVANRYPQMNIIEVGAGTGGATKKILQKIGDDFSSYTFTDISTGFFEEAEAALSPFNSRLSFKRLDVERDPASQGFSPGSYDMVVAYFVVHATSKLEESLRNIRALLKLGGYVVLGEVVDAQQTRGGFIFGTLPGWWAGVGEGRTLSPSVTVAQWDGVLRSAGFSGVDTITPSAFNATHPGAVFVSQALDDRVSFLREPLAADVPPGDRRLLLGDLVIIGGSSVRVKRLVASVREILSRFAVSVVVVEALDLLSRETLSDDSTVLNLGDLDKPVFRDVTPSAFEGLKLAFQFSKTMLWVTSGRRADDPYSNMVVGFGRTAAREFPELRLQFLDFENSDIINAHELAEAVLRLKFGERASRDPGQSDLLWSAETEVVVTLDGQRLIPRQEAMVRANNRYNSERRPITEDRDVSTSAATIVRNGLDYAILDVPHGHLSDTAQREDKIELVITHSTISAIKTRLGHQFLVLGTCRHTGLVYMTLTGSLMSIQRVPRTSVLHLTTLSFSTELFLEVVAAHLTCMAVLDSAGQVLLVHNPTPAIAICLSEQASNRGVEVMFTTDMDYTGVPDSWIKISLYLPKRDMKRLIPFTKVRSFWEVTAGTSPAFTSTTECILDCLPANCRVENVGSVFSSSASTVPMVQGALLVKELNAAVNYTNGQISLTDQLPAVEPITIDKISKGCKPQSPTAILSWVARSSIPIRAARVDSTPLFRPDRTYWLVGLSGNLGLSLCDWMIGHGAKTVAISSRNPYKIDSAWVEAHAQSGVTVVLLANDVTNESELRVLHETLSRTLPPIAGAVHGAMVLRDTPIRGMSFEQLTVVLEPKVKGAQYLDRILDQELDFFILISSMSGLVGNIGQANYGAASTFMSSLAARRRRRGLAASVINVGAVLGAGYITRELSGVEANRVARSLGLTWMSVTDVHQMFGEAVLAGRLGSPLDEMEISGGLPEADADGPVLAGWHSNPIFGRYSRRHQVVSKGVGGTEKVVVPLRERLGAAETRDDARNLITETLCEKLRTDLQLDLDDESLIKMHTNQVGLDSLIAVNIRSWFLKHYEASIPVLQILGGICIGDLVEQVLRELPAALTPKIEPSETTSVADSEAPSVSRLGQKALLCQKTPEDTSESVDSPGETGPSSPPVCEAVSYPPPATTISSSPANKRKVQFDISDA